MSSTSLWPWVEAGLAANPLLVEFLAHVDGCSTHEGLALDNEVSGSLIERDIGRESSVRQQANLGAPSLDSLALGMRQEPSAETPTWVVRPDGDVFDPEMIIA